MKKFLLIIAFFQLISFDSKAQFEKLSKTDCINVESSHCYIEIIDNDYYLWFWSDNEFDQIELMLLGRNKVKSLETLKQLDSVAQIREDFSFTDNNGNKFLFFYWEYADLYSIHNDNWAGNAELKTIKFNEAYLKLKEY